MTNYEHLRRASLPRLAGELAESEYQGGKTMISSLLKYLEKNQTMPIDSLRTYLIAVESGENPMLENWFNKIVDSRKEWLAQETGDEEP